MEPLAQPASQEKYFVIARSASDEAICYQPEIATSAYGGLAMTRMTPSQAKPAQPQATLVDLLDRILDRGLLLNADIIISLAGVPLIGINLRAALAGMDTMVKYGLLQDSDRNIRAKREVEEAALVAAVHKNVAEGRKVQETQVSCQGSKGVPPFPKTSQGGRVGRNTLV